MILVTVGTHHQPFDRLVRAADAHAATRGERVVLQRGTSREPAPHCEVHDWLPPDRLEALAREARVVVTHAGPGSIFLALDAGTPVIVVPRDPRRGEHVDGHQIAFAEHLAADRVVVHDTTRLSEALESVAVPPRDAGAPLSGQDRSDAFARRLASLVDEVVDGARPSCPRRVARWLARGRR